MDSELDRQSTGLESRELRANTIVVVVPNHGESFGALEYNDPDVRGHGTSLYPDQLRVPLLVIAPRSAIMDPCHYISNPRRPEAHKELVDLATDSLARRNPAPAHPLLERSRELANTLAPGPTSP